MDITRIFAVNYTFLTVNIQRPGGSCGSDVFIVKTGKN